MSKTPRGIRNNNPLNIRRNPANRWLGAQSQVTDNEFEQFTSMEYGVRAAMIIIRNWLTNHKTYIKTARHIITKWAPPSENNTQSYCNAVSSLSGLNIDTSIHFAERLRVCNLLWAMAVVENGMEWSNMCPLALFTRTYDKYF